MQPHWRAYNGDTIQTIYQGDALEVLRNIPSESVHCCITSPPYWDLRDYGVEGQIGLELTLQEYVERLVAMFREVRRVLRPDGTLWLNLGDSYWGSGGANNNSGITGRRPPDGAAKDERDNPVSYRARWGRHSILKPKDLIGIPWRVAFALQEDGWYLRSDIIWAKPNPIPESVKDRPTKAHEYIFLLAKSKRYYYDAEAIKEPLARPEELLRKTPVVFGGRNKHDGYGTRKYSGNKYAGTYTGRNRRSVWTIATQPFPEAHFATFPEKLVEPCILAGTSPKACPKCGAPWKRVVGRGRTGERWEPTCTCEDNDGSGRCVVLDPFVGSGTTLLVAQRLGRSGIGIELNPDYCVMASQRIDREQRGRSRGDCSTAQ